MFVRIITIILILACFGCQNQECEYVQVITNFNKDYIETSDSTDFQGQKTLIFEEENFTMKANYSFCRTSAKGVSNCSSQVSISNLTDRNVRIYFYRSQADRNNNQNFFTAVDVPPYGTQKGIGLSFISAINCVDLDRLFSLIRISYR